LARRTRRFGAVPYPNARLSAQRRRALQRHRRIDVEQRDRRI
jgi:hypothetical protein